MGASKADNPQSAVPEERGRRPEGDASEIHGSQAGPAARSGEGDDATPSETGPDDALAEIGQSIDELIGDVEAVCGSSPSDELPIEEYRPPEEAPTHAADAGRDPALQEIDEALADDVESLLHGDFEAVSAVLDDVFDDPASGKPESPQAADANDEAADDAVDESDTGESLSTGTERSDADQSDGLSAAGAINDPDTPVTEGTSGTPDLLDAAVFTAPECSDGPQSEASETEESPVLEAGTDEAVATESSADTQATRMPVDEPAATDAVESAVDAAAEPSSPWSADREDREAPTAGPPSVAGDLRHRVAHLARPLLQLMSIPMQLVPPRFRPIVDWIALSLIFWVPIVWIVALFVV